MSPVNAYGAPLGHSISAHRVFGWCLHCPERGVAEEVAAWRMRENDLHDRYEAERDGPHLQATSQEDRDCGECGQRQVSVVTMTAVAEDGAERPAGGWALCRVCGATPHPTMDDAEAPRG